MNNEKLEHFITCLRAVKEGKQLQSEYPNGWNISDISNISLREFNPSNWRVKPDAPKITPWAFETAPEGPVKAKRKADGQQGWLVFWPGHATFCVQGKSPLEVFYSDLPTAFERLSGEPLGIEQKEESEWPKWATDKKTQELWSCNGPDGPVFVYFQYGANQSESEFESWDQLMKPPGIIEIPAAEALALIAAAQKEAK